MKVIHNADTGETLEIALTADDLAKLEAKKAREEAAQKAAEEAQKNVEQKRIEALSKLEALGLTADDLKALGL